MTTIEDKFNLSCDMKNRGYEEQAYRLLYEGYVAYCNDPDSLGDVTNYALVGNCLYAFYLTPTIVNANESVKEQVASIAFLFLSKAIEKNPTNTQMRSCRIHLIDEARQYLKHIFVESHIDIPNQRVSVAALRERPTHRALKDLDKMIYSELVSFPTIASIRYFSGLKECLETDRLVPNRFNMSSIDDEMKHNFTNEGKRFLQQFVSFLNQKVCINGDIDFDTEYE